jgi:protein-L-isoaspartate(D-aspartate) O-methyltransferase
MLIAPCTVSIARKAMIARLLILLLLGSPWVLVQSTEEYAEARRAMVREIQDNFRSTASMINQATMDPAVEQALQRVPRHEFVPPDQKTRAYLNQPLPIGHGQTISQPYIVALMTDLLDLKKGDVVLEIGTGSGYHAAVLAELAKEVYTIEIIEPLGLQAAERFKRLGYKNIETRIADGYYGWKEHAPFDAIVVTAAASYIPPPLIQQLKPGGKMIIPVGSHFLTQYLVMVEKDRNGVIRTRELLPVMFVPLKH